MRLRWPRTKARLRREAADWLARLEGGEKAGLEAPFRSWYEADPAHAEAFDRVSGHYRQAGLLRHSKIARSSPSRDRAAPQASGSRYALAAAIAAVLLIPVGMIALGPGGLFSEHTTSLLIATNLGQIRQVRLSDGSKVTLDADSIVKVELGRLGRRVTVRRGRARLAVAPDARPFIVEAGALSVRTARALVDAEVVAGRSRIEMLSGTARADVASRKGRTAGLELAPGKGLDSDPGGVRSYSLASGGADWTSGMLQFDGTPLSVVIAEANRYSNQKVVLSADLGELRVSGAFRSGDNAALARSLAVAFNLKIDRTSEGDFLLSRTPIAPPTKKNGG